MIFMKTWRLAPKAPEQLFKELSDYHPLIVQLLYNRQLQKQNEIDFFLNPDYEKMHDPFLFKDMKKAVERVWQAIERKEKIVIHGDYDADGVTSAAVLYRALKILKANVDVFIPHRENDGYGLNHINAKKFVEEKVELLITVDCGITNFQEIEILTNGGVDVIVTDHHEPPEQLPQAIALIDPKIEGENYPFTGLAGAGLAYKLVEAVFCDERIKKYEADLLPYGGSLGYKKWLLDIVAIGTVADMAPLLDENRILVKWGLIVLARTKWIGLQMLLNSLNPKVIDTYTIGFQIGPRLNAAGRMNHASPAFQLLVTESPAEAENIIMELNQTNFQRQKSTEIMVEQAKSQIAKHINKQKVLFAYQNDWPPGIVGLVAGRICDELYMPVLVMTDSNDKIVGSGRSIEQFNITAALRKIEKYFSRFGGHSQACGFTLKDRAILDNFQNDMRNLVEETLKDVEFEPYLDVDAELIFTEINEIIYHELSKFEPFGENNTKPRFLLKDLYLTAKDFLGSDNKHLRLMVKQGDSPIIRKMIGFGLVESFGHMLNIGDKFEAVVEVGINEWNGNREFEYKIHDIKINN